jgi:hypothetical protein
MDAVQYGEVAALAMGIALLVVLMAIGVFVERLPRRTGDRYRPT